MSETVFPIQPLLPAIRASLQEHPRLVLEAPPGAGKSTGVPLALLDALKMFPGPIIELHISNIHRREPIYHRSYVSMTATAVMAGLGAEGYATAIRALEALIAARRR